MNRCKIKSEITLNHNLTPTIIHYYQFEVCIIDATHTDQIYDHTHPNLDSKKTKEEYSNGLLDHV